MVRPNEEVADLLREYADLLRITGGDPYRARVYERAARGVAGHGGDVATLAGPALRRIPGVGASIADKIAEYVRTGRVAEIDALRARMPDGVRELTSVPTLGPKKALALSEELGISSVDELDAALESGRLNGRKGFGPKTLDNLRRGVALLRQARGRAHLDVASDLAERIVSRLAALPECGRCEHAGSLRRMRETVGDLDILATADEPGPLMAAFAGMPEVSEVIARGETKTSVRTTDGVQVDLRVVPPEVWGAALQYFTGSQAHNVRVRELAVTAKLRLSEYGLFDAESGERIVSATEEEVYERLGLPWIPPTLREDRGEIEAARAGELPELVDVDDIRGDLHTHTDLTDGVASLSEMVESAAARGLAYYAITDHAPDLVMQRMTDEKMLAQREEVRRLDGRYGNLRLLHGTELNIAPDGGVDWPAEFLDGFDLCVASVHSHFDQDADRMTRRLIRACENPYVDIIGHPTTRKLGRRGGVDADLDAVFDACARTGTALEINASPDRLDLDEENVLRAKRHGVAFAIDTDAHAVTHLDYLPFGVGVAQRGWLTPDDVINAWPLAKLRAFLRRGRVIAG